MFSLWDNELLGHIANTVIALVAVFLVSFVFYWILRRGKRTAKDRGRLRSRIAYVAVCLLAVVLVQIWVQGFTHVLTMLSLVAAGLVVSNKETIMNLVGWLIINWRGIFTEGDNIRIGEYVGLVHGIRPLYFELYETDGLDSLQATGRLIKIPNAQVITSIVKSSATDKNIRLFTMSLTLNLAQYDVEQSLKLLQTTITTIVDAQYARKRLFSKQALAKQNRALGRLMTLAPEVIIATTQNDLSKLAIDVRYYAYASDRQAIEQAFWLGLAKSKFLGKSTS